MGVFLDVVSWNHGKNKVGWEHVFASSGQAFLLQLVVRKACEHQHKSSIVVFLIEL